MDQLAERLWDEAGIDPEIHVYPAHHAFLNDANPDTYDAESARIAWGRTVDFLRDHVR